MLGSPSVYDSITPLNLELANYLSTGDYLIFVFCLRVVYSVGVYFSPEYKRYCFASCATIAGYGVKQSTNALDITKGIFSPGAKLGISILYTSKILSVRLAY